MLASCGARSAQAIPPVGSPLAAGPNQLFYRPPAERRSTSCSGYILVVYPSVDIIEARQQITLNADLFKRYRQGFYCSLEFVGLTPARWSSTGGTLKVENGQKQAQFSAAKIGTYSVIAKTSMHGTSKATLTVQANHEKVVSNFKCTLCGAVPTGLMMDKNGAIYGTTQLGGNITSPECSPPQGCGTVFKLISGRSGYTTKTLYVFQGGSDGGGPLGGVVADKSGALFGTTPYGGSHGRGTVFKLTPHGSSYTKTTVHSFRGGSDGAVPLAGLVAGASGQFYGTTQAGGAGNKRLPSCRFYIGGCGTVYELSPRGSGYSERVLYAFKAKGDGAAPFATVTIGKNGDLYGTTYYGGNSQRSGYGDGTVFRLTRQGSGYAETFRYSFQGGNDGVEPGTTLVLDSSNALYGTTFYGGTSNNGTVFKLTPTRKSYTETILYSFKGPPDGSGPAGLSVSPTGILYGTTSGGGAADLCQYGYEQFGCGTAFSLKGSGSTYTEHILHLFANDRLDGGGPGALIPNAHGTLYGDTGYGGSLNTGTIFELSP